MKSVSDYEYLMFYVNMSSTVIYLMDITYI